MLGQDNDGEFDNARQKISDLLARERRTWKAFVDSLFSASSKAWSDWHDHAASGPAVNPLDLVHHLLWRYLEMTRHQFVAVSLWIAHTFVYQRFTVTPRLMVTSPVRGCGKTTLLDLLEGMCVRPLKSDSITAASIYQTDSRQQLDKHSHKHRVFFSTIKNWEDPMHHVRRISPFMAAAACLLLAAGGSLRQANGQAASPTLDYQFFKDKVQAVFLHKREGHTRCVACHTLNNAPLHLVPLSPGATTWNEEQSRQNFQLVQKVAQPGFEGSKLVVHPLAEEAGGDPHHGGGQQFASKSDPDWQTLHAWVLGAK